MHAGRQELYYIPDFRRLLTVVLCYECTTYAFPSPLRLGVCRIPTTALWLSLAGMALVYLTDWKVVLGKVPYVKGRFPPVETK